MIRGRGQDWGDAQRNRIAQGIQPLAGDAPLPQQRPSAAGPDQRRGEAVPQDGLPPWFYEMGTNRAGEPLTAGLDMGDGPGSEVLEPIQEPEDDAELVLALLEREFEDDHAAAMLQEIRSQRRAVALPTAPGNPPIPGNPPGLGPEATPAAEPGYPIPEEEPAIGPSTPTPPPGDEAPMPDTEMPPP